MAVSGRPTKYRPEYDEQAKKLARLGQTDEEMASFFEVATSTFYLWLKEHESFSEAIKKGKAVSDAEVADKLYKRATGYSHDDTRFDVINGRVVATEIVKHYPPETAAAIFWLKNRQRDKWKDKHDIELPSAPINLVVNRPDGD